MPKAAGLRVVWSGRLGGRDAVVRWNGGGAVVILPGWLRDSAYGQRLCSEVVDRVIRQRVAV